MSSSILHLKQKQNSTYCENNYFDKTLLACMMVKLMVMNAIKFLDCANFSDFESYDRIE